MKKISRGGVVYFSYSNIPYKSGKQNEEKSRIWNEKYDKEMKEASDISKLDPWKRVKYDI